MVPISTQLLMLLLFLFFCFFDPYNVLLANATNIPQRLKTGFMVHGHICWFVLKKNLFCIISVEFFFVEIIKHYYLKVWDKQDIEKKKLIIPQKCIKIIKSDGKEMYNTTKDFRFQINVVLLNFPFFNKS